MAQYVILIIAYMIPVIWLSVKHTGNPVPQLAYGYVLEKVTAREQVLNDPTTPDGAREAEVRAIFKQRESAEEARLKALETGGTDLSGAGKEQTGQSGCGLESQAGYGSQGDQGG